jgi:hypothetical protein
MKKTNRIKVLNVAPLPLPLGRMVAYFLAEHGSLGFFPIAANYLYSSPNT